MGLDREQLSSDTFFKKLDGQINKYNPGMFKLLFIVLWLVSFLIPVFNVWIYNKPGEKGTVFNYISTLVGFLSVLFLFLSRYYGMKNMDELQRLIQLERANIFLNGIIILVPGVFIIAANFNIHLKYEDAYLPIILLIGIALFLSGKRYK